MKLGANTVLFGGHSMETAFRCTAMAGYDGVELSAMPDKSDHLALDRWQNLVPLIRDLSEEHGLELTAIEQPSQKSETMALAFKTASALGIPVVNCGPGGQSGDEDSLRASIDSLARLAAIAEDHGTMLCVKAHVGCCIDNSPTTLRAMESISSPAFGIDFDPSHIYRAGEDPCEALLAAMPRLRHVHIRDCLGRQQDPGRPEDQANGRGEIDLLQFIRLLHEHGYTDALNLEIIGAKEYSLEKCCTIAAEARGHMQACLQACGAR